jgi:hypothetical protein
MRKAVINTKKCWTGLAAVASAVLLSGMIGGCAKTVSDQSAVAKQVEGGEAPAAQGFFGKDLPLLQPGTKDQAALVYINPNAQWNQYTKIMLEPVEFWDAPDSKLSPTDQHMLTAYFYNQIKTDLQKNFTLIDQGGPGVIDLQVALVNASAAIPVLRSVSVVIPQLRVINAAQSLATGSYAFVGSAEAQMKATDSSTGELLAAAIDKQKGGLAIATAAQWQWGDAENAMNYWAEKMSSRLLELQGRTVATQ